MIASVTLRFSVDRRGFRPHSIFVGTWNVNAKPPTESLVAWLAPAEHRQHEPDVLSIGFQVCEGVSEGSGEPYLYFPVMLQRIISPPM